jgi:thioredoxin 1
MGLPTVSSEEFGAVVIESTEPIVLDFWGPRCAPCIRLEPFVEALEREFRGKVRIAKVITPDNRKLCAELRVMGLPTFLAFKNGREVDRLVGDVTLHQVRAMVELLSDDSGDETPEDRHRI